MVTSVRITGSGFTGATAVAIAGQPCSNVVVVNDNTITCVTPTNTSGVSTGPHSVIVTAGGNSNPTNSLFSYATYAPTLPAISALATQTSLPDPFLLNNGNRCVTRADWDVCRQELLQEIKFYFHGQVPGTVPFTVLSTSADQVQTGGTMRKRTAVLSFTCPNGTLSPVTINLWIPVVKGTPFPNGVSGSGPWPMLIGTNLSFSPLENTPTVTQNSSIGLAALNALVSRGYIIADTGRDDFCLDWGDDGGDVTYNSKCFTMFPFDRPGNGANGFDWGTWGGWAWGYSRCMDYFMTQTSIIDTARIGITGHSRGSNCAEIAAAIDTRFALCVSNQNGFSLFRNGGLDTWSHYLSSTEQGWFNPRYLTTIGGTPTVNCQGAFDVNGNAFFCGGNTARMPIDSHAISGLIAPRLYVNLMSLIDPLREPRACIQRLFAAQEIWRALGADVNNCRVWENNEPTVTGNGHSFTAWMWNAALDFADNRWFGRALPADIPPPTVPSYQWTISSSSPVFGGLPKAYNWTTPILT